MNSERIPRSLLHRFRLCFFLLVAAALGIGVSFIAAVGAEETVFVRWVDDGDTIVLADGRRVRYIGINAPEVAHNEKKAERLGPEAKRINRRMVYHARVRMELDTEKFDRYGRLLAYIFAGGDRLVNREMLLLGYAYCLYRFPNTRYHESLLEAQRAAMQAGKGIWGDWKRKGDGVIGNRASRRFHLAGCLLAKQIAPRNRVRFKASWEAFWQGYAPAKDCQP